MPQLIPKVRLAGRELDPTVKIDWVRLEMNLETHHLARVRLVSASKGERGDLRSKLLDDAYAALSEPAEISLEPASQGHETLTFKGLLVGATHERELDGDHAVILVVASPTVLLDAGPRTRIWEEATVSSIAGDVVGDIDALDTDFGGFPSSNLPYETQFEESDYGFLKRLAGRSSVWLYYDGQKLVAAKSLPEGTSVRMSVTRDPEVGRLEQFSVTSRLVSRRFVEEFSLADDKAIVKGDEGEAKSRSHPLVDLAKDGSDKLYTPATHPSPLGEVFDGDLLKAYARARGEATLASLVVASATSSHPGLRPGFKVAVEGGGGDEDREYLVTRTFHEFVRREGYRCELTLIPVETAYPAVSPPPPVTALNRATVLGDYSDSNPGMIRVEYGRPVEDSSGELRARTTWARVLTAHGGESAGFVALPEIGDEVVIGHLGGRATHPVVLGCVYNKGKPGPAFDEIDSIADNDGKVFRTRSGNTFRLTDVQGQETIELRSPDDKNVLRLTMDGPKVEIETMGEVLVTADQNITMTAKGDLTLKSDGNMTLDAKGELAMKTAKSAALEAMQDIKGKANKNVELSAMASLKATGTASAEVSGTKAELKGQGMVGIQAPLVKIN